MAFPVVVNRSGGSQTGTSGTHPATLPASLVNGRLLLVVYGIDGSPVVSTTSTGWTLLGQAASVDGTIAVFVGVVGVAGALVANTSDTEQSSHNSWQIDGWSGDLSKIYAAFATGASVANSADPPALTPPGGSKDYLWIAAIGVGGGTEWPTAGPSGWTNFVQRRGSSLSGMGSVGSSELSATTASQNPGVFTHAAREAAAATIAIEPAAPTGTTYDVAATIACGGEIAATGPVVRPALATLAGGGGLTATAWQTHSAVAALTGGNDLAGTATRGQAAAVTLTGGGSLVVAAVRGQGVAATLAGGGALVAAAVREVPAAAVLAGAGTLTASGGSVAAATLAGGGSLVAAAQQTHQVAAVLAGGGQLAATGQQGGQAAAQLAGGGALVAAAFVNRPAAATLEGGGRLVAAVQQNALVSATLTGGGTLSVSAGTPGAATLEGGGSLTATFAQTHAVAATVPGAGALTAAASQGHAVGATLAGGGTLSTAGTAVRVGATLLAAAAGLSADGRRVQLVTAALPAAGMLTADARIGYAANAVLPGGGGLTAGLYRTQPVSGSLAGGGQLVAATAQTHRVAAVLNGGGALTADGRRQQPAPVVLSGVADLVATGTRVRPAVATLTGGGTLTAVGRRQQPVVGMLAGGGQLYAEATALSFSGTLAPSLWAIDRATGTRVPLPHFTKLVVSPVRNAFGKIAVDYPVYGRNFDQLASMVKLDRDLEVEVWLQGKVAGALRGILTDTTGDDVEEDAVWTFEGTFLEVLADEALVWTQAGDPKRELVFSAANAGSMVATVLQQTQGRGGLAGVTRDFTTSVDSAGVAWSKVLSIKFSPSAKLTDMLGELVEQGMVDTWRITAGRVLQLFQPGSSGVDRTLGTRPVIFRRGLNLSQSPRKHSTREAGTAVLVAGSEGLYDSASDATALARLGRRKEVAGTSGGLTDISALAAYRQTFLDTVTPSQLEVAHALEFAAGQPRPSLHFDRDDWVWSDTRGYLERLRVQQWTLTVEAPGRFAGGVVLNTLLQDRLLALLRRLKRISSGSEVVGTSQPPPTEDTMAPAAPIGVTANSTAYADGAGGTLAVVSVGWTAVTTNADTTAADDVAGYRVEWRLSSSSGWQLGKDQAGGSSTATSFGGVQAGATIRIRVAAYDANGNTSAWSGEVALTTETDTTAPPTPSTPTVFSRLGVLMVDWDGLGSVGQQMPADFDYVEVHMSAASGFTPTTATYYDRLYASGTMPVVDQAFGSARFFKLVAVDRTDPTPNKSAASAQASGTASQVVSPDIFDGAVGSLKLADLAVTTAKINALAVNDAQMGNVSAGKITTGTLSAAMTLTGIIRTATTGLRWEGDPAGIRFYNSSGAQTIRLEGAPGNTTITGTLQSGLTGTRWTMEQDGTLRHYSNGYTGYSQITSLNGDLIMRGRMDGNGRSGRINANTIGVGLNFSSDAEIPDALRSEIVVFDRRARITVPLLNIEIDGRYTPPDGTFRRVVFSQTDSGGSTVASSVLEYKLDSASNPGMVAITNNAGWKAEAGAMLVVNAAMSSFMAAKASDFVVSSSQAVKQDIDDLRAILDPLATIRAARARKFVYTAETTYTPPATEQDPDPTPVDVEAPTRIGLLAEELPPELTFEMPEAAGGAVASLSIPATVGLLWGALGQMQDQEIRSVAGRVAVPNGAMLAGATVDLSVAWDEAPLEVPTGGVVTVYAAIAWLGRTTALIVPGSITATGCTVRVRALAAVSPSAGNPITVEATALYLYAPPYTPEP